MRRRTNLKRASLEKENLEILNEVHIKKNAKNEKNENVEEAKIIIRSHGNNF